MTSKKHLSSLVLSVLLIAVVFSLAADEPRVTVRWVADGDTIILDDGRHLRYIGMDTPEVAHENQDAEPMGNEARTINRRLVQGWRLRLEFDREKKDRHGRQLAYVYRNDGLFINAELLRQGYAHFLYSFPNIGKAPILLAAQRQAMEAGRGIWRSVKKDAAPLHAYLGNRHSKRFHAHDCAMGRRIAKRNRIRMKNRWSAFWDGYAPAMECIAFPNGQ